MEHTTSRIFLALVGLAAALSCAKTVSEGTNAAEKRFLDAYMSTHYPNVGKVGKGIYIIGTQASQGAEIADSGYVFARYVCRSLLDSTIISYTDEQIAKKLGEYSDGIDFSPYVFQTVKGQASQGILDLIAGGTDPVSGKKYGRLRIGEVRTAVIPGWLTSTAQYYDTEDEYIRNVTGSDYIYEFRAVDQTSDITQWQIDTIERFLKHKGWTVDSLPAHKGLYYYRDTLRERQRGVRVIDTVPMPTDTTVYINYIGRLLNGRVFDTNIQDTAKVWNIYNPSRTYEPESVQWNADSTAIKFGSSGTSVIKGFSLTLFHMHPFESGHGIFTSEYGYGTSGSGDNIPPHCPLVFDIDIVKNPYD